MATELPLNGIKVLDLSTALAGPVTSTLLGDFGADVVKIEDPRGGDPITRARPIGPGRRSLQWAQEGRNKKSVALDLRQARGQEIVRDLVPLFDVVVTNFRPPTLVKWGFDPETLSQCSPHGVLLYLTAFGLTGPYKNRGAFDRVASAFSGLTYASGEPDQDPTRSGFSVVDYMSSYLAAFSVMTALYHRDVNGGKGQVIDLALYEAAFRAAEDALVDYAVHGNLRERTGNRNPYIVPATDFTTADGRISVHAGTDPLFGRLVTLMGTPGLASDPRFSDQAARVANQTELYRIIQDWLASKTVSQAIAELVAAEIPCSPVMNIADIATNEHYLERGTIINVEDPDFGTLPMVAPIPHLSQTPGAIRTLGPRLGEHTEEVLAQFLGMSQADLAGLTGEGVIAPASTHA